MKIYSFILICLTLGVFYSLAVKMEHQKNLEEKSSIIQELVLKASPDSQNSSLNTACSNHSTSLTTDSEQNHYLDINDDFSMQVTGKAHRYLNTGVSFIEYDNSASKSDEKDTEIAGS